MLSDGLFFPTLFDIQRHSAFWCGKRLIQRSQLFAAQANGQTIGNFFHMRGFAGAWDSKL
jgi:hypothetical protein